MELFLKACVYRGAQLVNLISEDNLDTTTLFTRHRLTRLLAPLKEIFSALEWGFDGTHLHSFEDFESLIRSIDEVDPESYSFRYSVKRNQQAELPEHFVINVLTFAEHLDPALELLTISSPQKEQAAELDRRWNEHLEDPGSAIPWPEVRRKLLAPEVNRAAPT